jgi:hypothetical protein
MKRLIALVVAIVVIPASVAVAADLEELLERSQGASYTAEQIISCNTPDGVREGLVRLAQDGSELWVGSTNGSGEWTLLRGGDGVSSPTDSGDPIYVVDDESASLFLGRSAITYDLLRDGMLRAEIVFDQRTGALVRATTFLDDGSTYCQRRFVSFDPTPPNLDSVGPAEEEVLHELEVLVTALPEAISGFDRLDLYRDDDGSTFAYYSDGFFSFAVFETPTAVVLPDGVVIDVDGSVYKRSFTAGQATYVWETSTGGMAFVGDLPPDLHESVLAALPESETPGIFRRLWRSLFG